MVTIIMTNAPKTTAKTTMKERHAFAALYKNKEDGHEFMPLNTITLLIEESEKIRNRNENEEFLHHFWNNFEFLGIKQITINSSDL